MTDAGPQPAQPAPSAQPNSATQPDETQKPLVDRDAIIRQIGGVRGLIDSGLPIVVFITFNAFFSVQVAVWSALGAGGALFALRLVRRESVQQAISGFLGVAIAAFIAGQTGEARDFFLPSLWSTAAFGLAFLVSVVIRWPLVGVIAEFMWPTSALAPGATALTQGATWRSHRALMRTYTWLTVLWAAVYALRMAVQGSLYLADEVTLLGTSRLVMGWPLTALEALLTVYIVRRVRSRLSQADVAYPPVEPA